MTNGVDVHALASICFGHKIDYKIYVSDTEFTSETGISFQTGIYS